LGGDIIVLVTRLTHGNVAMKRSYRLPVSVATPISQDLMSMIRDRE
jgi:hypothetical protein